MLNAKHKKAQSTLEYIVVFTAIIGVILLAANGVFKSGVKQSMDGAQTAFGNAADKLSLMTPATTGGTGGTGGGTTGGTGGTAGTTIVPLGQTIDGTFYFSSGWTGGMTGHITGTSNPNINQITLERGVDATGTVLGGLTFTGSATQDATYTTHYKVFDVFEGIGAPIYSQGYVSDTDAQRLLDANRYLVLQ